MPKTTYELEFLAYDGFIMRFKNYQGEAWYNLSKAYMAIRVEKDSDPLLYTVLLFFQDREICLEHITPEDSNRIVGFWMDSQ